MKSAGTVHLGLLEQTWNLYKPETNSVLPSVPTLVKTNVVHTIIVTCTNLCIFLFGCLNKRPFLACVFQVYSPHSSVFVSVFSIAVEIRQTLDYIRTRAKRSCAHTYSLVHRKSDKYRLKRDVDSAFIWQNPGLYIQAHWTLLSNTVIKLQSKPLALYLLLSQKGNPAWSPWILMNDCEILERHSSIY